MPFAARDVHGGGVTVVELTGEVDVDTAPRMARPWTPRSRPGFRS